MDDGGAFFTVDAAEAKLDLKDRHSGQARRKLQNQYFNALIPPPSGRGLGGGDKFISPHTNPPLEGEEIKQGKSKIKLSLCF